jgi:hypothetical protein
VLDVSVAVIDSVAVAAKAYICQQNNKRQAKPSLYDHREHLLVVVLDVSVVAVDSVEVAAVVC